ncbi:MAG TPA: hypothetical protein VF771_00585 [Longimicrobiaceae bacterium]
MSKDPLAILPPPGPLSPRRLATVARLYRGVGRTPLFGGIYTLPLMPLISRYAATGDTWAHVQVGVPPWAFGVGAPHDFRWCFEAMSQVKVRSVNDICEWLQGCRHRSDQQIFVANDYWQHPRTFEMIRQGDCEDHALWAWRKLRDIGFPAWFVVGKARWQDPGADHTHAWVQFTRGPGEEEVLLEAVAKQGTPMIRPLAEVRDDYCPHFSVEHGTFWTRVHGGFLKNLEMYQGWKREQRWNPGEGG